MKSNGIVGYASKPQRINALGHMDGEKKKTERHQAPVSILMAFISAFRTQPRQIKLSKVCQPEEIREIFHASVARY